MPGLGGGEVGGGEEGGYAGAGEFVTVFGVYGFAGGEVEVEGGGGGGGGDVDLLGGEGFEVHLDAGFGWVPTGSVAEVVEVEVCAEVAVEAGEDVEVEGCGDAGGVVVGGEEVGFVFVLVPGARSVPRRRVSPGRSWARRLREDVVGVGGGEVADAGADVEGEGAGVGEAIEGEGFAGVVGDLDADGDAGDVVEDVFGGFGEGGVGDVDGLVDDASLLADGGGEEDAGLGGGAGA